MMGKNVIHCGAAGSGGNEKPDALLYSAVGSA